MKQEIKMYVSGIRIDHAGQGKVELREREKEFGTLMILDEVPDALPSYQFGQKVILTLDFEESSAPSGIEVLVEKYLHGIQFPVSKESILYVAASNQAPVDVQDYLINELKPRIYASVADIFAHNKEN